MQIYKKPNQMYPQYARDNRGIMELDLSSIAVGSIINSVTLTLTAHRGGNHSAEVFELYTYIGDGLLEAADWNPLGTYAGTSPSLAPLGSLANYDFCLNASFVESVLSTTGYAGFQFYDPTHTNDNGSVILTSEYDSTYGTSYRPYLTIDYEPSTVPEPTTLLLLGSGLIGLAGFGRKFRKSDRLLSF